MAFEMSDLLFPGPSLAMRAFGGKQPEQPRTQASFLHGAPERWVQSPNMYAPQQQGYLNQLAQMGMQGMQSPSAGFQPIADQARAQFQQQTVPGLAERFTGGFGIPGASSAQRSSGFAQTIGAAGAGLDQQLAAMQAQYGQGAIGNLLRMLMMGLQPQTQFAYQQPQSSGLQQMLTGASSGLGQAAGMLPMMFI